MKFFGNVTKLEAEIEAANNVADPALAKAEVKTITVDGKAVPAAEAPLAAKFATYVALCQPGTGQQTANELIASNARISGELEKVTVERDTAKATVGGLQQEKTILTTRAEAAEGAVNTLTAEKAQLNLQITAATQENARLSKTNGEQKLAIARQCLTFGCLDLKGADGKALTKDASDEQISAAIASVSFSDMLAANAGAVSLTLSRLGVSADKIPAQAAGNPALTMAQGNILAQYNAIKDPQEKVLFYRQHKAAIDAAYRAAQ